MPEDIDKLLCEVRDTSGLDLDTVQRCLEKAIEQASCEYFGVQDCEVDLNHGAVDLDLYPDVNRCFYKFAKSHFQQIQENGVVEVELASLPPGVIARSEDLFRVFIEGAKADMLERRWRQRVHSAVEGVIIEKDRNCVKVNLGDEAVGIMMKAEWTPREVSIYRQGRLLHFYVLRVKRGGNEVVVYLSRGSINFPAALLRNLAPWINVKAVKRIRGKKTWLVTDMSVTRPTLLGVQKELMGEVIEVKGRVISGPRRFHHQGHLPGPSYTARPFVLPEQTS